MKEKEELDIAYQGHDIIMKLFADMICENYLQVFDKNLPKIKELAATNLPIIIGKEYRLDNLFLLEDGTYLVIDYESAYKTKNLSKYVLYYGCLLEKYYTKNKNFDVRFLILYTMNKKPKTINKHHTQACDFRFDEIFMCDIASQNIKDGIFDKIKNKNKLTPEDILKLITLPMAYKNKNEQINIIQELIKQAKNIEDEDQMNYLLSTLTVFNEKIIPDKDKEYIKELIDMTTVGQMYKKEKIEYGKKKELLAAKKMLDKGMQPEDIIVFFEDITINDLKELEKNN